MRRAIHQLGVVAEIAKHFEVSRQTIYDWLDYYELRNELREAKHAMREVAADVVYGRLMSDDEDKAYDAARFVLRNLKDDGEMLPLSPEVIRWLQAHGIPLDEVARQFEQMLLMSEVEDMLDG